MKQTAQTGRRTLARRPSSRPSGASLEVPQEYGEECGGKTGVPYRSFATPPARLTRITVWHRDLVDGLLLETDQGALPKIGGTGMHRDIRQDSFALAADEVLTGISVEYSGFVNRILFHTNLRDYGPFGGPGGEFKKRLDAPVGSAVIGFKGRHWIFVDSIQLLVH